jgi:hypothetical protein
MGVTSADQSTLDLVIDEVKQIISREGITKSLDELTITAELE